MQPGPLFSQFSSFLYSLSPNACCPSSIFLFPPFFLLFFCLPLSLLCFIDIPRMCFFKYYVFPVHPSSAPIETSCTYSLFTHRLHFPLSFSVRACFSVLFNYGYCPEMTYTQKLLCISEGWSAVMPVQLLLGWVGAQWLQLSSSPPSLPSTHMPAPCGACTEPPSPVSPQLIENIPPWIKTQKS